MNGTYVIVLISAFLETKRCGLARSNASIEAVCTMSKQHCRM